MERKNPRASYTIRVIAGAYVAYLAFKVVKITLAGDGSMSVPLAVFFAVVMAGCGISLAINGLMGFRRLKDEEEAIAAAMAEEAAEAEPVEAVEETVEEEEATVSGPAPSIMQRASMPAHLRVDDEDAEE